MKDSTFDPEELVPVRMTFRRKHLVLLEREVENPWAFNKKVQDVVRIAVREYLEKRYPKEIAR